MATEYDAIRPGSARTPLPHVQQTEFLPSDWVSPRALEVLEDLLADFSGAMGCCAYIQARETAVLVVPGARPWCSLDLGVSPSELNARLRAVLSGGSDCHLVSAPLTADGALQGELLLALPGRARLGAREREILSSRAAQFAARLEAERLREEAEAARRSLRAAVQIHRLLVNEPEMESLLGAGLGAITQMVDAGGAGVLLHDPESGQLVLQRPAFNIADGELIDQYRVPVAEQQDPFTVAVQVFLTGQPFVTNEPLQNPHINQHFIRLFGVRNSATLPLIADKRTIGVLHVINKRRGGFSGDDSQLLALVASQLAVLLENARLMARLQRQEQEAKLLYDVGTEIAGAMELDQILSSVAEKTRYLVRAELASISLLDPDTGHGTVRVAAGDRDGTIRQVRFATSLGSAAAVSRARHPITRQLPPAGGDVDDLDLMARSAGFRTVLCVPLVAEGQIFGLLHAWRRDAEPFTGEEAALLSRLSVQAAIALVKARQYEHQRQALAELRRLNGLIEAQHGVLKQASAVHRELTALVLEGKGHQAITDTLSRLVRGPVAVLDRFHRVLALAQPESAASDMAWEQLRAALPPRDWTVGRDAGERPDQALTAVIQSLADQPKPMLVPSAPGSGRALPRLMAPVVVEHEVLGYISLLQNGRQFDQLDFVAVEQAVTICAVVMLKEKTALEVEYRVKGDLLFDLCRGRYQLEQDFMHRAAVLGYDLQLPRAVLLLEFDPTAAGLREAADALSRTRRLLEMVRGLLQEYSPQSLVAAQGERVLVLAPDGGLSPKALAEKLHARLTALIQQTISIGIGSTCRSLTDYGSAYKEAWQALAIARRQGVQGHVSAFPDLGIYQVLFQVPDTATLRSYVGRTLGPLIAYDRQHGTPLVYTLDQFLKHHGNRQATCKSVFVHINTLNYRLRRIGEVLEVSLENHTQRLNLDLALRILETTDPSALVSPAK